MRPIKLKEEAKKVAIAAGRLNPPTLGHEKLIDVLASQGCEARLYASHSCDPKKNPLSFEKKTEFLDEAFGDKVNVMTTKARNMFEAMHELYEEGFTEVVYICGGDRMEDGTAKQIEKYNGADVAEDKYYKFEKLSFVSAGSRDENAEDEASAASASKARKFASEGDLDKFMKICPSTLSDDKKKEMYDEVRKAMGVKSEAVAMYDEERTVGFESYLNKLSESDSNGYRTGNPLVYLYWVEDNVLDSVDETTELYDELVKHIEGLQADIDDARDWIDIQKDEYLCTTFNALADLVAEAGYELAADFVKEQATMPVASTPDLDALEGTDPEFPEPMFRVYCTYVGPNGDAQEDDGDPRYDEVSFDDIDTVLEEIITDFLNNLLKGSYRWSPIDYFYSGQSDGAEDEEIVPMSAMDYQTFSDKDGCDINSIRIDISPYQGTEDSFEVCVSGDGSVTKDTYGISDELDASIKARLGLSMH